MSMLFFNWYNKKSYSGNVTFLRKKVFSLLANNEKGMIKDLEFGLYVKCYFLDKERENVPKNVCENICQVNASVVTQKDVNKIGPVPLP